MRKYILLKWWYPNSQRQLMFMFMPHVLLRHQLSDIH